MDPAGSGEEGGEVRREGEAGSTSQASELAKQWEKSGFSLILSCSAGQHLTQGIDSVLGSLGSNRDW